MILLDTSALIEWTDYTPKGKIIQEKIIDSEVFVSVISINEYLHGFNSPETLRFVEALSVLSFDVATAIVTAKMELELRKKGKILSKPDAFIAGTAMAHNIHLLTCDKDFKNIPGLKTIVI